jgi:quercetin dioxygenase-like cupin family protein
MSNIGSDRRVAHLVDMHKVEVLNILGPTLELLTPPDEADDALCVMRGTIPPGGIVPLHSHADPETFILISGKQEGLVYSGDAFEWVWIGPGDVFHVPSGAKHAFRNLSREPAVSFIASTSKLGRFFQEVSMPFIPGAQPSGPPSGEVLRHFLETAERYSYWNATAEENARVGLSLPLT